MSSTYTLDLSAFTLVRDAQPVNVLDATLTLFLTQRQTVANPSGELQVSATLSGRVFAGGSTIPATFGYKGAEHGFETSPGDVIALINAPPTIAASVGPAWAAINSAAANP